MFMLYNYCGTWLSILSTVDILHRDSVALINIAEIKLPNVAHFRDLYNINKLITLEVFI